MKMLATNRRTPKLSLATALLLLLALVFPVKADQSLDEGVGQGVFAPITARSISLSYFNWSRYDIVIAHHHAANTPYEVYTIPGFAKTFPGLLGETSNERRTPAAIRVQPGFSGVGIQAWRPRFEVLVRGQAADDNPEFYLQFDVLGTPAPPIAARTFADFLKKLNVFIELIKTAANPEDVFQYIELFNAIMDAVGDNSANEVSLVPGAVRIFPAADASLHSLKPQTEDVWTAVIKENPSQDHSDDWVVVQIVAAHPAKDRNALTSVMVHFYMWSDWQHALREAELSGDAWSVE